MDHPDDFGVEGIAPSVCTDEKLPLNVNDCELDVAGAAAGEEHDGFTESSFCLMQYEITKTFNRIRSEHSLTPRTLVADRAEHRLHATRDAMEAKYFRYSSGESPISRFAAHIIAMILAKRRLLLYISLPYNQHSHSLPPRTCDFLFLLGIHVLELSRTVQKARCFERWRWLGASYFQWSAATFVASELAARPQSPATRRAWHVINGLLDDWPEATRCLAKAAALKALITNAIRNRDAGNIWNMGIPSELDDQNQYGLPSETAQGNASAGKKTGESKNNHDQQQFDLSTLGQGIDLEDFVLSEMSFDQNAFSTDFTFT